MIARSLVKHATLRYQLVGFLIFKFGGSPNFLSTTPTLSQPSNKTKVDLTPASGACERFRHRRHRLSPFSSFFLVCFTIAFTIASVLREFSVFGEYSG